MDVPYSPVPYSPQRIRHFVRGPGCELYYEVTGSGPALLFAHGLGGNHLSWWQQVACFSARFSCVTFAHRGFAPSSERAGPPDPAVFADDLGALIDHLGLGEVSLVAQSMGGWSCLGYALREPARVRALVMAATSGVVDYQRLAHPEIATLPAWSERAQQDVAELRRRGIHPAAGARMAREQPALHFLYRAIDDLSHGLDKEGLRGRLAATRNQEPDVIRRLRMPVLFIVGEEDVIFPPGAAAALASIVPNAQIERVPQAGHSVYFERADLFNRLVDTFLTSALGTGVAPHRP
jgi:pimeloyl-ACP methyl ester carboxylesterase